MLGKHKFSTDERTHRTYDYCHFLLLQYKHRSSAYKSAHFALAEQCMVPMRKRKRVQSQGFWKSMTCFSFFRQFVFIYIHLVGTVSLRLFARTARCWRSRKENSVPSSSLILCLCRFLFSSIFLSLSTAECWRLTFYCTIVDYVCSIEFDYGRLFSAALWLWKCKMDVEKGTLWNALEIHRRPELYALRDKIIIIIIAYTSLAHNYYYYIHLLCVISLLFSAVCTSILVCGVRTLCHTK